MDNRLAHDEIREDIEAMSVAIRAISGIPTLKRRQIALNWIF
jgi:hypothetical protein